MLSFLLGMIFNLNIVCIAVITAFYVLLTPKVIKLSGVRHKENIKFLELSTYMEQLMYSFLRNGKILQSLEDMYELFPEGKINELIEQAVLYIRMGEFKENLYKEALLIIENYYKSEHLKTIDELMINVEDYGGEYEQSLNILQNDRAMWVMRIETLQQEKKRMRTRVLASVVVSFILCLISVYLLPADMRMSEKIPVQVSAVVLIIVNSLIALKIEKKMSQSWIGEEKRNDDAMIIKYYKKIIEFDIKSERIKSLIYSIPFAAGFIISCVLKNSTAVITFSILTVFMLNQHNIGYRLAYKTVLKRIKHEFSKWLIEIALLLQRNNVQMAIFGTIKNAHPVMAVEIKKMLSQIEKSPNSVEPYMNFLNIFKLADFQSAMKMLYSISETGVGDAQKQIDILLTRNNELIDKEQKNADENHLVGMALYYMLPMLTGALKLIADMTVFLFEYMRQMGV